MGSKAGEIRGNSYRNPKKYGKGIRGDSASPDNQSFETRFHRLVDSDMLSDCEFVLGPQKTSIKGHKVFFSAASEVFHAMFCSDLKETNPVHVEDLEPEGFKAMKQFIYTGEIVFESVVHALYTYTAARKYIISNLVQRCVEYIKKTLKPSDVLELQDTCRLYCISEFDDICSKIIRQNTREVMSSAYFQLASIDTVESILESPTLNLESEVEIFIHFERWALAEIQRREIPAKDVATSFNSLKTHIRFLTMSGEDFVEKVEPSPLLTREEKYAIAINKMKLNPNVTADSISMIQEPRTLNFDTNVYKHIKKFQIVNSRNKNGSRIHNAMDFHGHASGCDITIRVHITNSAQSIKLEADIFSKINLPVDRKTIPLLKMLVIKSKFRVLAANECDDLFFRNQNDCMVHFHYEDKFACYTFERCDLQLIIIPKSSLNAEHFSRSGKRNNLITIQTSFLFTLNGIEF